MKIPQEMAGFLNENDLKLFDLTEDQLYTVHSGLVDLLFENYSESRNFDIAAIETAEELREIYIERELFAASFFLSIAMKQKELTSTLFDLRLAIKDLLK